MGESSEDGSMGGWTKWGEESGGSMGGCQVAPRSMLKDEYGV